MNWFTKFERKYGRYAIHNLMFYVIVLNIGGFMISIANPSFYYQYLQLSISGVMKGQIWRLFTFVLDPPADSVFTMFFFCMLYYTIGTALENVWGAFRFNVYYFTGVLMHVIAAFILYFVFRMDLPLNLTYLNLSLFLAFGAEFPDFEILLFFIFPIKIKWLAIIDAIFFGIRIFLGFAALLFSNAHFASPDFAISVAALLSALNFLVYFFNNRKFTRYSPKQMKRRASYNNKVKMAEVKKDKGGYRHKCAVCGRTEADDPNLEFRFCSKCQGSYEYCSDHLYTHRHIGQS